MTKCVNCLAGTWVASDWVECQCPNSDTRKRTVTCKDEDGTRLHDYQCMQEKPATSQVCDCSCTQVRVEAGYMNANGDYVVHPTSPIRNGATRYRKQLPGVQYCEIYFGPIHFLGEETGWMLSCLVDGEVKTYSNFYAVQAQTGEGIEKMNNRSWTIRDHDKVGPLWNASTLALINVECMAFR